MKRVRAVVEVSVPDNVNLTERHFAKLLRRSRQSIHLAPHEMATRTLEFKEFGRVVQFSPDGVRVAPPKPPASFEILVLRALWMLLLLNTRMRGRSKGPIKQWLDEVRALAGLDEEPRADTPLPDSDMPPASRG